MRISKVFFASEVVNLSVPSRRMLEEINQLEKDAAKSSEP
jgi:hypothetical protein